MSQHRIEAARSRDQLDEAADLFREYAATLPIKLDYQGFEAELATLPGKYAPPDGEILLARDESGVAVGCVAVRYLQEGQCEMKRLYIRPGLRGSGLGRVLVAAIMEIASRRGYREMFLDTLPEMIAAIRLYRSFGFVEVDSYYDTPVEQTVFFRASL